MRPVSMRTAMPLCLLLGLAAGLLFWMGPRPVFEPWAAEVLPASEARRLLDGARTACARGEGSIAQLAEANGIAAARLPPLAEGARLLDTDNDGDLDLLVPAPAASGASRGRLRFFLNDGAGFFRDASLLMGPWFSKPFPGRLRPLWSETRCVDADRDGKLDLAFPLEDGSCLVLSNRLSQRRYLRLVLEPAPESAGRRGRVTVLAGGREQVRFALFRAGPAAASRVEVHFGLGDADVAEEVRVEWPSGGTSELRDLSANRTWRLAEAPAKDGSSRR